VISPVSAKLSIRHWARTYTIILDNEAFYDIMHGRHLVIYHVNLSWIQITTQAVHIM